MTTTALQTEKMMQPAAWVTIPDSSLQSDSVACSAPSMTIHGQPKSLPPKCASVPGLIPSPTHSPRVVYRTSSNPAQLPTGGTRSNISTSSASDNTFSSTTTAIRTSKALLKSRSMSGTMTTRKPLRSSPLAGPPALFETESDSDSSENEDTLGPMVSVVRNAPASPSKSQPSAQLSLSWNISPIPSSPVDSISPSHPDFVFDSSSLIPPAAASSSMISTSSSRTIRVLRPPRPPPECHLHPRAIVNNDNDVVTGGHISSNWYPTMGIVSPKYKCTCRSNAKNDTSDGLGKGKKNGHSVLKKKRFSAGILTSTFSFHATPVGDSRSLSSMPSSHTAHTTSSSHYHNMIKPLPNPPMPPSSEVQIFERKATETAPPPRSRSVPSGSGKMGSLWKGRESEEAGGGGWGGGLRDYVDGDARGAGSGADVAFDGGGGGGGGMGGIMGEGETPLARSIIPGELVRRRTERSERASGSEGGASMVVSPVSVQVEVEGESRRRRDEWEIDLGSNSRVPGEGGRGCDDTRRMTMADFGVGDRKKISMKGTRAVNVQEEISVELDAGKGADFKECIRRRSMGNVLDALSTRKSTRVDLASASIPTVSVSLLAPHTPPHKRLSMSTSSPLASTSSVISSPSPTTSIPKTKRPTPTDNSWLTANPYGETPKFTRLGLSASNVVMPVSARDRQRAKKGQSTATVHDNRHPTSDKKRWSTFPSSSSCTLPSDSTPSADEGCANTSETEFESETLSRSSSASATTTASSGSAYWSTCTATTMTSPSSTSEGRNDSLERVVSMDLGDCTIRPSLDDSDRQRGVKADSITPGTLKQTNHAHKSQRRSLAIMKGLRGTPNALSLRTGSIYPPQPQSHLNSCQHGGNFGSSELTLATVDTGVGGSCGVDAMSSSECPVYDQQPKVSPVVVDSTSSTTTLGRHSSLYSLTYAGQHGVGSVEGMCEGKKLKGGDSSVKRWWKMLVSGGR